MSLCLNIFFYENDGSFVDCQEDVPDYRDSECHNLGVTKICAFLLFYYFIIDIRQ